MAKAHPLRFSTKFQDDETDLLYYGYRYYNASAGRWLSRDPAGEDAGDRNLYLFVSNRPLDAVDELGLIRWQSIYNGVQIANNTFFHRTPCCCPPNTISRVDVSITGSSAGPTVTALGTLSFKGCVGSYVIYWWDCYSASSEGGFSWSWKDYGYSAGGLTYTKTASPNWILGPLELRDPYHLAVHSVVVYVCCSQNGFLDARYSFSNELMWQWNKRTKAWVGPY